MNGLSLAVAASVAFACGGGLRTVPTGVHGGSAAPLVPVAAPPPPAKIEHVPRDPGGECAWLDGRWEWSTGSWEWIPGAWVVAPDGCYFAPPEAVWTPTAGTGLLFYRPGRWYRDRGESRSCDARRCR